MTKNQIEYAKHLEQRRSNQAQEELTRQRDERSHKVATGQLEEQARANRAKEAQAIRSLDETIRANKATEAIRIGEAATSAGRLAETVRSDLAREAETAMHNRAMELKDYAPRVDVTPVTHVGTQAPTTAQPVNIGVTVIDSPQRALPGLTTDVKRIKSPGSSQLTQDVRQSPMTPRDPDYRSGQTAARNSMKGAVKNDGEKQKPQSQLQHRYPAAEHGTKSPKTATRPRGGGFSGGAQGGGFSTR